MQGTLFTLENADVLTHRPFTFQGITFTITYNGLRRPSWGGLSRPSHTIAMTSAHGKARIEFCNGGTSQMFGLAAALECIGFDMVTLSTEDAEELPPSTIDDLKRNAKKIGRVFGTVDNYHNFTAEYLYRTQR